MAPKILLWDLENAPSTGFYYEPYLRHGGRNIIATLESWFMLSYSWKWLGEKTVHCRALCDYPSYAMNKRDDSALIKDLWGLLDQADIAIAHNGDKFDIRKANARFLQVIGKPPSPYKTIDTLKVARREFMLESNRLGDLGEFLGLGRKLATTGWDLWRGCMDGDPKSWALMKRYNKRDVALLGEVYEKLKPWVRNHPDLRAYDGSDGCPTCASMNIQHRGFNVAKTRRTQRMHCQTCGTWFSGRAA